MLSKARRAWWRSFQSNPHTISLASYKLLVLETIDIHNRTEPRGHCSFTFFLSWLVDSSVTSTQSYQDWQGIGSSYPRRLSAQWRNVRSSPPQGGLGTVLSTRLQLSSPGCAKCCPVVPFTSKGFKSPKERNSESYLEGSERVKREISHSKPLALELLFQAVLSICYK